MEILITVALVFGIIIAGYFFVVFHKYKNFRVSLREGDPIHFYIGEERLTGTVYELADEMVVILFHGGLVYKSYNDVYPVWGVRYSRKEK